ncbi:flagellar assembly protein FliH [Cribrihabitans marinus]|uniref:Flagellar assembly protein FliH n=1 Tax=Cribrihabitans marinus TaxID=1227549 RepID=A0A1H7DSH3_9RHOB|nr:ABC transporter ATP-binding protein [Cribrihabitans marinus]GGH39400.1 flagellar biosynthesis protein [Cribrihabitans marinus]SEK01245.1 flagellar assembly protein FliH [Cribrihabitans marinus]
MTIAHLLEDFTVDPMAAGRLQLIDEDTLEERRLAAFEQGYAAGWEDAVAAQATEDDRVVSGLAKTLEDLSFTYHEALAQMAVSLRPLFQGLVGTVLPDALNRSFGHHIVEQLNDMASEDIAQPALLVVPKGAGKALQPILDRDFSLPVQLIEEASLPPGQASLRIGQAERDIDCNRLLASISEAMDTYIHQASEGLDHG